MNIIQKCPSCGSEKLRPLKGYEECCRLVRCRKCGLTFASEIPDISVTQEIYDGYGRNDYLSEITVKRYNELLDTFERYRKTNKILDVGCGIGYFLDVAKKRGWEVYGTEFSRKAVSICEEKGIVMYDGDVNSAPYTEGQFDIITSFEVLEHVVNPSDIMFYAERFLRKGGAFYLTTPNFKSLVRIFQKSDWDVISKSSHPEHLVYYTRKSYKYLLKSYGMKSVYIKTTGLSISRLKAKKFGKKEKYISNNSTDEKLRVSIESSRVKQFAKKIVNFVLSLFGVGDSLKSLAVKI